MIYDLPTTAEIQGVTYEIRSDYRAVLDILIALSDPELSEQERAYVAMQIFYPDFDQMPQEHYTEAVQYCYWFIDGGEEPAPEKKGPRLIDWEQDFKLIAAPVNRVMGQEVRALEYCHWWTFLAAYYEIGGDCTFAQVVSMRDKLARHKKIEKADREWLRKNRNLVDFKRKYTDAEEEFLKQWT